MKRTWNAIGLAVLVASMICLGGCGESTPDEVPAKDRPGYGKTYTFARNYPAGEYATKQIVDMDEKLRHDGSEVSQIRAVAISWISMEVAEHNSEGGSAMETSYTRAMMSLVQQGNTLIEYDSGVPAKPTGGRMATPFGDLLDRTFKIEFDKDGNVLAATGMEGYFELMSKDPASSGQLEWMKESLSNKGLALSAGSAKEVLPPNPVTLDDTWPVAYDDSLIVVKGTARLYEVVSTPEGDLATIKMAGEVKGFAEMPNIDFGKSSVTFESTIHVYVATGVQKTSEMEIVGTVRMHDDSEGFATDITRKIKTAMEKVK